MCLKSVVNLKLHALKLSTLAAVMGKNKVTMFTMNKLITPHLVEKLEKTDYVHEEEEKPAPPESNVESENDSDDSD
jgi:chromatin remodeling complex protein RSC6